MGLSQSQALHMTPKQYEIQCVGYRRSCDNKMSYIHCMGKLIEIANLSANSAMFNKNWKSIYPDQSSLSHNKELTEREKELKVKMFFAKEEARRIAWRNRKKVQEQIKAGEIE